MENELPIDEFIGVSPEEAIEKLNSNSLPILEDEMNRPLAKGLLNSIKGFSPLVVNQICVKANVENDKPIKALTIDETSRLIDTLSSELSKVVSGETNPVYCLTEDNEPKDFCYTNLEGFENVFDCSSISEAIDEYYAFTNEYPQSKYSRKANDMLKASEKGLKEAEKLMPPSQDDLDYYRNYGNNIDRKMHEQDALTD